MKTVVLSVSVLLLVCVAYAQELLTNPGFETGDYTGWTICGGQSMDCGAFPCVWHSGSYGTQECGCCGDHDAGGGYQQVSTDPAMSYLVGGWARTCSYGGTSDTSIGHGGITCGTPTIVIGLTPAADCNWYQFTTTVSGETSISVHYAWPDTGWGDTCNAADDMTVFAIFTKTGVDGWMFYD